MATNRKRTVSYLQLKDRDGLNNISQRTGATLSKIIERAVKQLLNKETRNASKN